MNEAEKFYEVAKRLLLNKKSEENARSCRQRKFSSP